MSEARMRLRKRIGGSVGEYLEFVVLLGIIILVPATFGFHVATELLILGAFALAFNILFGFSGQLSFGHSLFFGGGSYVAAIATLSFGVPPLPMLTLALLFGVAVAFAVGVVSFRLSGLGFAIITLGFSQLGYHAIFIFDNYTGGSNGLIGIRREPILGVINIADPVPFYVFVALVVFAYVVIGQTIRRSLFGQVLAAIRQNEDRTEALGVDTYRVKIVIFCVSGGLTAFAGSLWALYNRIATPGTLYWTVSGDPIMYSLIGGIELLIGPIVGAGFLTIFERSLLQGNEGLWNIVVGSIFVAIVLFYNRGIGGLIKDSLERWLH